MWSLSLNFVLSKIRKTTFMLFLLLRDLVEFSLKEFKVDKVINRITYDTGAQCTCLKGLQSTVSVFIL